MTDTTAKIRSKGLDGTGLTEEIATRIADAETGTLVCVVEISYAALHKESGGKRAVDFVINTVEPAPDQASADHLRNLARAIYHGRRLHAEDKQPQLDSINDVVPSVGDVITQGQGVLPEPPDDWEYEHGEGQHQDEQQPVT